MSARNSTIAGSCIHRRKGPAVCEPQQLLTNGGTEGDQFCHVHRTPILKDIQCATRKLLLFNAFWLPLAKMTN